MADAHRLERYKRGTLSPSRGHSYLPFLTSQCSLLGPYFNARGHAPVLLYLRQLFVLPLLHFVKPVHHPHPPQTYLRPRVCIPV